MKASVQVTKNGLPELSRALKKLQNAVLQVGIAESDPANRREDSPMKQSDLGWVHEHGAPAAGIPARPFLAPGVEKQKDLIKKKMSAAMRAALNGDEKAENALLEQLGMQVADGVRNYLSEAEFEPLKPATIANRHRSRGTKSRRPEEEPWVYEHGVRKPNPHFGEGVKPLINTGSLRDSISAYVNGKKVKNGSA